MLENVTAHAQAVSAHLLLSVLLAQCCFPFLFVTSRIPPRLFCNPGSKSKLPASIREMAPQVLKIEFSSFSNTYRMFYT